MYTFDQVLWFKSDKKTIEYRVKDPDKLLLYGWKRIATLGKLAARYRHQGEAVTRKHLPGLPADVWDAILAIAAYQDTWAERQARQAEEEEDPYAHVGKWED